MFFIFSNWTHTEIVWIPVWVCLPPKMLIMRRRFQTVWIRVSLFLSAHDFLVHQMGWKLGDGSPPLAKTRSKAIHYFLGGYKKYSFIPTNYPHKKKKTWNESIIQPTYLKKHTSWRCVDFSPRSNSPGPGLCWLLFSRYTRQHGQPEGRLTLGTRSYDCPNVGIKKRSL